MSFWDLKQEDSAAIKKKLLDVDKNRVAILCGILAQILLDENDFKDYIDSIKGDKMYVIENFHQTLKIEKIRQLQSSWRIGKTVQEICDELQGHLDEQKKKSFEKLLTRIDSKFSFSNCNGDMTLKEGDRSIGSIDFSNCLIYYGPPGTGKTRKAKIEAAKLVSGKTDLSDSEALDIAKEKMEVKDSQIQLVQFHPSYSYNDFMETVNITKKGYTDRIFKKFADKAKKDPDEKPYVMIIDEINRANVSEVLGELLYGLEYRERVFITGVSNQEFFVPDNLYIIGTMNTADKTLQNLDYAVRRRFAFEKVEACKPKAIDNKNENAVYYKIENENIEKNTKAMFFLNKVFEQVKSDVTNSVARGIIPEDIVPGISYFIVEGFDDDADGKRYNQEHFEYKIIYELIPLLKEYIKDGMFTKRKKIHDNKSLIEIIFDNEYYDFLNSCMKEVTSRGE